MPSETVKKKTKKHPSPRRESQKILPSPSDVTNPTTRGGKQHLKSAESLEEVSLPPQEEKDKAIPPAEPEPHPPIDLSNIEQLSSEPPLEHLPAPSENQDQAAPPTPSPSSDKPESPSIQAVPTPPAWHAETEIKEELPTEPRTEDVEIAEPESKPKEEETIKISKSNKSYVKTVLLIIFFLLLLFALAIALNLITTKQEFVSPVPEGGDVLSAQIDTQVSTIPKEVIGFLPYWNIKEETNFRYQLLSQLVFFSLQIDADGNIIKLQPDGTEEPGWTAFKGQTFGAIYRKAKDSGAKVILTIQAMDQEIISSVLNDPAKRHRAITQTLEVVTLKNLDGVNIDFEYIGSPSVNTAQNFSRFVQEFRENLQTNNPNGTLTVDVYADAVAKVRLWDIPNIVNAVDHILIMAYDFHRASSTIAAPIAPIRGAPQHWEYDIGKALSEFTKIVPLEKIILGVPYYGYEWRTSGDSPYATTYPKSGSLATFKRIQTIIAEKNPQLDWDEIALAPRVIYTEKGNIYQIYYENETSLGLKYDLVNQSGIAGIGIWALGYDGDYPNLWNLLAEKLPRG